MANLDLIPKLPVLAVQAGIFIANLGIMKKLFMEPYLRVRDAQTQMTFGSQGDAARLLTEADKVSDDINARLQAALKQAKSAREKVRGEALAKRHFILESAQNEARKEVSQVESEIKGQLESERAKVSSTVALLAQELYNVALN